MIELSSEASRAYEVKLSSLERTDPEEDPNSESPPALNDEDPKPGPDVPEYSKLLQSQHPVETLPPSLKPVMSVFLSVKIWKKVLEEESSGTFLNFEEQFRSMHLDSECTENPEEEES